MGDSSGHKKCPIHTTVYVVRAYRKIQAIEAEHDTVKPKVFFEVYFDFVLLLDSSSKTRGVLRNSLRFSSSVGFLQFVNFILLKNSSVKPKQCRVFMIRSFSFCLRTVL